jgi:hypothetical protein
VSNFAKISPVAAAVLIHVDRRADTTKVTVAFRERAKAPYNKVKKDTNGI